MNWQYLIKRKLLTEIIMLLVILILGGGFIRFTWIRIQNEQIESVMLIARSIESTLPKDDLGALDAKPDDINKPEYQVIKNTLKAIIRVNPKARFVYIYMVRGNRIFLYADSEPVDSKDYSPPGQEYTEADSAYFQPFKDGKELITSPVSDRWGTWRSVFIPIKDGATAKTIAVLGMDFNAKLWDNFLLIELTESSVLIVILFIALLFLFRIKVKNWSLRNEMAGRKMVEETLRDSEEKYRLIFEHSPLGLISFDKKGIILACNDNFVKIIGSSKEVLIGLTMLNLADKKLVSAVQKALDGNAGLYEDVYHSVTSKKVSYVRALFAPMGEDVGCVGGGVGIIEDVTARKQAEGEIEENKEKYRGLSEATFESIFLSEKGKCIEQNLTAEKMFGYTHEEALGRYGTDWIAVEDREKVLNNILKGFEEPYEALALRKDGTTFPCILQGRMMHYKGREVRVTTLTDITERKQAEHSFLLSRERARQQRNAIAKIAEDEVISSTNTIGAFQRLTEEISNAIHVSRAGIWLFSDDKTDLECISLFNAETKEHSSGAKLTAADYPLYFEAINNESRISAADVQNDPRTIEFTENYLAPLGITSMLDAGIYAEGELKGVVCLEHTAEKRSWHADEESFASTIASIVAQILANDKRRLSEEALRESEEKYRNDFMFLRSIIESPTDIIIFALDKNYCYTAFTKFHKETIKKIWGVDIQIGMNMLNIISNPEDREKAKINFDRALQGEYFVFTEEYGDEKRYRTYYEDYYSSIRNSEDRIVGVSVFVIDITERKRAETTIQRNLGFIEALLKSIPVPVFFMDKKGRYLGCNELFSQLLGVTNEEIMGKTVVDLWPGEGSEIFLKKDMQLIANPENQVYESKLVDKTGNSIDVIFAKNVYYDENGHVDGLIGAFIDITEQKRIEEALRIKDWAIESAMNAIAIADLSGNLKYVNPAFLKLWGYKTQEEVLEKSPMSFWHIVGNEANSLDALLKQGSWSSEMVALNKDGLFFDVQVEASMVLDSKGKPNSLLASFADVTERKKMISSLEEALIKAESGNSLKTAFMNNISHEIRTPLNAIIGFSNLITMPEISSEEKIQYFSHLEISSHRLLSTITNYMDISLIASGNMEVHRNSIDLHLLFHQLCAQFQPFCDNKNLVLHLAIPEKTDGILFHSDEGLFRKIMSHLLNNAIKFTFEGEIIFGYTIKQNGLGDSALHTHPKTEIEIFVKDTGIGIKREALSVIFESFKQEEFSYNRGFEGSGLGLSIAQGLVQLLGGEIRLKSVKGSGSEFSFSLPFNGVPVSLVTEEMVDKPIIQEKPVILIAEDDEANLFYLESILNKKSISVISAINGKEAVDKCREHPEISLVLMDIKMPVMNGLQAASEIKMFRKELTIIACTAFGMSGDEKNALQAGCDDYLTKPVSRATLLGKLKKYGVKV